MSIALTLFLSLSLSLSFSLSLPIPHNKLATCQSQPCSKITTLHTHSHMQSTQPYDSVRCVKLFCTVTVSAGVPAVVTVGRTPLPVMQRIAQENAEEFNLNTLKHI